MQDILDFIFSNPDTLSPKSICEFFVFIIIVEFIGIMFSWINGRRY